ncbi:putative lipoprotein [Acinetobacter sp. 1239920]|nr:putative lipoprotein [Acinetobacter sp. 1239920]
MHKLFLVLIITGSLLLSACNEDEADSGTLVPSPSGCKMHCAP